MAGDTETISKISYDNCVVTVAGTKFMCARVAMSYVENQMPVMDITLNLGSTLSEDDLPIFADQIYSAMLNKKKGDDVVLTATIRYTPDAAMPSAGNKEKTFTNDLTLFKGVMLGWGPIWVGPSLLKITVWAIPTLCMLDWASAIVSPVHGSGFDDTSLPITLGPASDIIPYSTGGYTAGTVKKDIWKNLIKSELINLCRATRFDGVNGEKVAQYLESKGSDKSEVPLSWELENVEAVIMDVRRTLYTAWYGRKSLWDALIKLSDDYKFSVICRANDFTVAPVLSALGSASADYAPRYTLPFDKYVLLNEQNALNRQITQSIGLLRGATGHFGFFDGVGKNYVKEFYHTPGEAVSAGVHYESYPNCLSFLFDPALYTARSVGLGTEVLSAAGYAVRNVSSTAPVSVNDAYNKVSKESLDKYASVVLNDKSYDGVTAVVRGALDFNICPGSTVRFEPPMGRPKNSTTPVTYYFGRVHSVSHVMDEPSGVMGTFIVLSHVRSANDQARIALTTHPLYNKRWVFSPLLTVPGMTLEPEYA